MAWYVYVAYFFGGMFLVNAVPHFVAGVMGRKFPSPFASPPGKGESSPMVNVLWGAFNLVIGYLLVFHVGDFLIRDVSVEFWEGLWGEIARRSSAGRLTNSVGLDVRTGYREDIFAIRTVDHS
jgi:hypothetical protein